MYFGKLHKKTPENCSINALKKSFMGPFRVLELLSTTPNHRIFLFSRALPETYIGLNLCILVNYTRKHPKVAVSMFSKKVFWARFGFSNLFDYSKRPNFSFF